jgi:hypothetical protein
MAGVKELGSRLNEVFAAGTRIFGTSNTESQPTYGTRVLHYILLCKSSLNPYC